MSVQEQDMVTVAEIRELRVPLTRGTHDALEDLKHKLRRCRRSRVTIRALVHEALTLLFEKYEVASDEPSASPPSEGVR